jgi:hypothetical protein
VAVTGDNLASVESTPDVLLDGFVRRVLAQLGLHLRQPGQHFLVCETVQWSGETIQSGTVRKEGIGERRADELAGVGGDVAPFVVAVDGDVEAEKLNEGRLIGEAKERCKVIGVVLGRVDCWQLARTKDVAVDASSDVWQLRDPSDRSGRYLTSSRSTLTSPLNPRRWVPSSPSWEYRPDTPWRTPNRGSRR